MNNNRKQQVFSFLDGVTEIELNNYIKERKINNMKNNLLNKIKDNSKKTHAERIYFNLSQDLEDVVDKYVKIGQAQIIAFVLECFYDDKYKIKDLKEYLKIIINNDTVLKEYVYDMMKDY